MIKKIIFLNIILINVLFANNTQNTLHIKKITNNTLKPTTSKSQFQSKLLNQLNQVLDKISIQDEQRKLKNQENYEKIKLERQRLQSIKNQLVKERINKGIIIDDDVKKNQQKMQNEQKILQQKIQYLQIKQQYNNNNIDILKKEIKNRIILYKELKKNINHNYIINSSNYDYIKLGKKNIAYVDSNIINDFITKANNDNELEKKYNLNILLLKSSLDLKSINLIKQILSKTMINPNIQQQIHNRVNTLNNIGNIKYIKVINNEKLSSHLYISSITDNLINLKRK